MIEHTSGTTCELGLSAPLLICKSNERSINGVAGSRFCLSYTSDSGIASNVLGQPRVLVVVVVVVVVVGP